MKKALRRTLIAIGIAVAVIYLVADLFVGQIATAAFNRYAPPLTETEVHLDGAALSPLSGHGTFLGLFVGNPSGWSSDKALSAGEVHVRVAPESLFSHRIVVNELILDKVAFVYETRLVSSNIGDILKNVKSVSDKKTAAASTTSQDGQTKFVIESFKITHAKVTFGVGPTAITLPMNDIDLKNLGSDSGGVSAAEITELVLKTVTTGLAKLSLKSVTTVGAAIGGTAASVIESTVSGVKKAVTPNP